MEPEVITRTEQRSSAAEPMLTLSQLRELLQDAAALERAQRPVVVHAAPQPATAPQTAPAAQVPPTHVYVPMPPAAAFTPGIAPRERSPWPLVFSVGMAGVLGSASAAAATGSPTAVIAVFGFASAWCAAAYHLVLARS